MILRQTLKHATTGYWDGGAKKVFDWRIDREYSDGKSRVGSYDANHYFEVKTGATEKATLGNARRHLSRTTSIASTFEYIDEETQTYNYSRFVALEEN